MDSLLRTFDIFFSLDDRRLCLHIFPLSKVAFVIVQVATTLSLSAITVPLCTIKGLTGIVQRVFLALGNLGCEQQFILFGTPKVSNRQ